MDPSMNTAPDSKMYQHDAISPRLKEKRAEKIFKSDLLLCQLGLGLEWPILQAAQRSFCELN